MTAARFLPVAVGVATGGIVAAVVGGALDVVHAPAQGEVPWPLIQTGSFGILAALLGGALARLTRARAVAVVLVLVGASAGVSILLSAVSRLLLSAGSATGAPLLLAAVMLWPLYVVVPLTVLPLVFPTGLLAGWGWRVAAVASAVAIAASMVATATGPTITSSGSASLTNPLSMPSLTPVLVPALRMLLIGCALAALAAVIVRFVRGGGLVRRQLAMFVAAVALVLVSSSFGRLVLSDDGFQLLMTITPLLVLVAVAVAVLRFQLYDVRVVVRRISLVSAMTVALTALFLAVYALLVVALGRLAVDPILASLAGAVAVVLCAEPLRRRLLRTLQRRYLGERAPLAVLASLRHAEEGSAEATVGIITATVADAVRSPGVSLLLRGAPDPSPGPPDAEISDGRHDVDDDGLVVPLVHRRERVGELRVRPRTPGEAFGPRDLELMHHLAGHAAAILYGLRRDDELAAARRQVIVRAAEERAQLGRDLHDGLGPMLAGAGLSAEALRRSLPPGTPDELVAARLAERLRAAAGQVRRFSHDLQPIAATEGGLDEALAHHVDSLRGSTIPAIELSVDVGPLPDAVDRTLRLVILEALNNVVHHAEASTARVEVRAVGGDVLVRIEDDGRGLGPEYTSGVGLTSMRRRVEAVGGSFEVEGADGSGAVVRAQIPVTP